jgi:hypothetical protein
MRETALVSILMSVGFTHGRAVAFEAYLDDRPVCGVSGDLLADLFFKHSQGLQGQVDYLQAYVKKIQAGKIQKGVDERQAARLF